MASSYLSFQRHTLSSPFDKLVTLVAQICSVDLSKDIHKYHLHTALNDERSLNDSICSSYSTAISVLRGYCQSSLVGNEVSDTARIGGL